MELLAKETEDYKANQIIDRSLDSIDESLALRAAMFVRKAGQVQKVEVTSKNLHLHAHSKIPTNVYDSATELMAEAEQNFRDNDGA